MSITRRTAAGLLGATMYKTPKQCIDMLVNLVSRNGTLLFNFPLKSDGTLDTREMLILSDITA